MKARNTLLASALALVAGLSFQASAAETSSAFQVTATVASSCAIVNAGQVSFSDYDPAGYHATNDMYGNSSAMQVRCNGGTVANLQLDEGQNKLSGSTCVAPARAMVNDSGQKLGYSLAQNNARDLVFGCDPSNSKSLTFANLETQTLFVYGTVAAGQDAAVGYYSDTVTVKVTF